MHVESNQIISAMYSSCVYSENFIFSVSFPTSLRKSLSYHTITQTGGRTNETYTYQHYFSFALLDSSCIPYFEVQSCHVLAG